MSSVPKILQALVVALVLSCAAVGAVGLAAVSAPPAHADDDVTAWKVRTSVSRYGTSRPLFSYTQNRGAQIQDGIDIANNGARPLTLRIYAADGFTTDSGGFDVLNASQTSKDVGSWVHPAVDRITIPARQEVQVPFTLDVPDDALPGDHEGGIVTVLDRRAPGGRATVIHQRVGLRIKVRVSGTLSPRLAIEGLHLEYRGGANPFGHGRADLSYTVRNTGNAILGGTQTVRLSGAFGQHARTVTLPRLPDLLPGEVWHAEAPVDDVEALLWVTASVTVTPVLTDAAGSTSTLDPVTASVRDLASIWSLVLLIGLVVLIVVLVWLSVFLVRRRRRRARERAAADVAAAVEEALAQERSAR